jgi:hypothetical protein
MERLAMAVSSITQSISQAARPMAEMVPITRNEDLPAIFSREADRRIPDRVLMWTESNGVAELRRPLTDAERATVERRTAELRSALAPWPKASREVLEGEVSLMLGGFAVMQRLDDLAAMGLVSQYLQLTRDKPYWAIVRACRLIREGKAGLAVGYCPNEAEFNKLIRSLVALYEERLIKAQQLLDAKPPRPLAPKLTRAEIEAKLGRRLGTAGTEAKAASMGRGV